MDNVIQIFEMKLTVDHLVWYLSISIAYKVDSFSMCLYSILNNIYGFGCVMVRKKVKYSGNAAFPLFRHLPLQKGVRCIL